MQQSSTVPYVFICNLFPRRDVAHLAVREPSPFTSRFRCVARWHLKATTFASYIFRMSTHVDLTEADFYSRFPCVMHAYMSVCAHYGQMRTAVPKTSTTGTVNTTTTEWSVSWTHPRPPQTPPRLGVFPRIISYMAERQLQCRFYVYLSKAATMFLSTFRTSGRSGQAHLVSKNVKKFPHDESEVGWAVRVTRETPRAKEGEFYVFFT